MKQALDFIFQQGCSLEIHYILFLFFFAFAPVCQLHYLHSRSDSGYKAKHPLGLHREAIK